MMNEPMALVLATVERLGGRVALSRLLGAQQSPAWASQMYIDDLAMMGLLIVRNGMVYTARVPGIVGGARAG